MVSAPTNLLLITSDQHNPFVSGFAGDPYVQTPNLDRLAASGVTFTSAYTNNPICMPARSSLATGRFGSTIGSVDNGSPYHQSMAETFGHRVAAAGGTPITFGKLHFDPEVVSGFDMRLPLQATRGYLGARQGWLRGDARPNDIMTAHARDAQAGPSEYELYDRHTTRSACRWLTDDAPQDEPWVAHVSYAYPHYPFRAPTERPSDREEVPLPPAWKPSEWPSHPDIDFHRSQFRYDESPLDEDELRRLRWVYSAMVEFVDQQIGEVLDALAAAGQASQTVVVYTSDHGDMLGSHGLLMKGVMYDASARVPMVLRGPGVETDRTCATAVSLVDLFPTVLDATGVVPAEVDEDLPGRSLLEVAGAPDDPTRAVFSEYHGPASAAASFMVRQGRWKYVRHLMPGAPPQLFDLAADPDELHDLASASPSAPVLDELQSVLDGFVDAEAADRDIRANQREQLAAMEPQQPRGGGEEPRTALGTLARGWSIPSPEIMDIVTDPDGEATSPDSWR